MYTNGYESKQIKHGMKIRRANDMTRVFLNQVPSLETAVEGLLFLPNLKSLVIAYSELPSISPLTKLPSLEALCFYKSAMADIAPLVGLPNLRNLSFVRQVWEWEVRENIALRKYD